MQKIGSLSRCLAVAWIAVPLLLSYACSGLSAHRAEPRKKRQPNIHFNRALTEKGGSGGFACSGMREKYQIEDTVLSAIENAPPGSEWFASEKEFYLDLIKNQTFDVLVVPFQTQMDGVDPTGRSLMSYRLATEIEKRTALRVAPLPLAHLALGSHERFYGDTDVYALARQLDVSHIIWGYAGTREDAVGRVQSLDLTVVCQEKEAFGSPEGSRGKHWGGMDLTPNRLPSQVFEQNLSDIISFLGLPEPKAFEKKGAPEADHPPIPQTPEALFRASLEDPVARSYYFQFLGMLVPPRAEFHRQYMFIRSLTALSEADAGHPDYAVLTARAYHHLNRRPAAIAALGKQKSDRAAFLRSMINGNLPDYDGVRNVLEAPTLDGFFATVEYAWLMKKYTYKLPTQHLTRWIGQYPHWKYFFETIVNDGDGWHVPSNWELKQAMDRAYPIGMFALERSIKKLLGLIQSQAANPEIDMAFQDHVRESLKKRSASVFFGSHAEGPGLLDHHLLFEGVGISNLLKRIRFYMDVQCVPEKAIGLCETYLQRYRGHPYLTLMHANMQKYAAMTLQGEAKREALVRARRDARLGLWWYGRQGWAFTTAKYVLISEPKYNPKTTDQILPLKPLLYGIASDYPFIPKCARVGFMRRYEDLIDWSARDLTDLLRAGPCTAGTKD